MIKKCLFLMTQQLNDLCRLRCFLRTTDCFAIDVSVKGSTAVTKFCYVPFFDNFLNTKLTFEQTLVNTALFI